jgi:hypothetical protein
LSLVETPLLDRLREIVVRALPEAMPEKLAAPLAEEIAQNLAERLADELRQLPAAQRGRHGR